jgi:hypothetical protein
MSDKRPHWLDDDIYKALRESADEQEAFLAAAFAELNDDWLEQALAELNDDWLEQALAELNDDVLDFVTPTKGPQDVTRRP